MTLAQLRKAKDVLALRPLSRAIGKAPSYLSVHLASGRELPAAVQAALDQALKEHGLAVK